MTRPSKYWIPFFIVFGICMFVKPDVCLILLGSLFCYMGIKAVYFVYKVRSIGTEAIGHVKAYRTDKDGDQKPIIEFGPVDGELIREVPFVSSSLSVSGICLDNNIGDEGVCVLYDPNNPKRFILKYGSEANYFIFGIFIVIGVALNVGGILSLSKYIDIGK